MSIGQQLLFVMLLLIVPAPVFGLSAEARVDRNRISLDHSLSLTVVVKGGDALVDTSVIKGWDVVPRGTSTSVSIINGAYSKSVTHEYLLMPDRPGLLTIPPLPVTLDGEIAYTGEIRVEVVEGPVDKDSDRDVFARASLSETTLVPGQQAIYTFRLYRAVQVTNPQLALPKFNGFSVKQAPEQESFSETVNGRPYTVTELSYVLVAENPGGFESGTNGPEINEAGIIEPGIIEVEPSIVTCDIPVGDSNASFGDPFFGNRLFSMGRHETRRFATESFKVKIKPLPALEQGVRFSGLVGHFSLGAGLDRESVKAGDSVTLTVTVSGTGNVMDAAIPEVDFPGSFKIYEDTPQEKITLTREGYRGERTFKRAIVPMEPGEFFVEPLQLTYFNTDTQNYETLSAPRLALAVEPSARENAPVTYSPEAQEEVKKKVVEMVSDDILALKEGAGVLVDHRSIGPGLFVLLLCLPFFFLFFVGAARHLFKREESFARLMEKRAGQALKATGKRNLPDQELLRNLYTALVAKVRSKGNMPGETITAGEINGILSEAGFGEQQIQEAVAMLNEIESARYGNALFDSSLKKDLVRRAERFILTLSVAFLCLFAAMPGKVRADDSADISVEGSVEGFHGAITLYRAGQFQDAAARFEQIAAEGVRNGGLYYNIGNSFLKAGDLGRAILWYERAQKLIPRDPDLRYNFDHALGLVKDVPAEKNIEILEIVFFWDNYLSPGTVEFAAVFLWFCFALHAGVRIFFRKKVFTLAGSILFILSLVVIATAAFNYHDRYSQSHAIILADQVPVRSGYSVDSTELFFLHPGTKVRVKRAEKGFLRISFSKHKEGWIEASMAGII
ncbi:MAG: BatD family protein [Desulfobacterium sp.]|nr:BatD family protein [Desulfobacterium sp.]